MGHPLGDQVLELEYMRKFLIEARRPVGSIVIDIKQLNRDANVLSDMPNDAVDNKLNTQFAPRFERVGITFRIRKHRTRRTDEKATDIRQPHRNCIRKPNTEKL